MSERLAEVRSQLGGARLIVVTKYADEAQVEALLALGVRDFGENRAKQLEARRTRWPEASWHFLGRIQRRDIRHLARAATSAHAFDRPEIAERWVEHDGPPIHLQVNLAEEAQKAGIPEQGLHEAIDRLQSHGVKLHGLSLMPPRVEESEASRPWMRRLRALVDATGLSGCSMGTSQDWRVALEEGSTCVRIGRWLLEDLIV